jgi:uncharacterized protein YjbI with pentapeptide repeats
MTRPQLDVESQRAQDEALQAYLDQLTHLLVTKDADTLIRMQVNDDVRQVIRARSVPLFQSLDSTRKWSLVLFLSVMGLLPRGQPIPIVSLAGADLRGVDGRGVPLQNVALQGANLSKATLFEADLSGASLRKTDLREANLMWANLRGADLSGADLRGAMLFQANLSETNLGRASLVEADLGKTSLTGAYLRKADLTKATLSRAYLVGADLTETTLSETYLRNADLSGTRGITNEELEQQAMSLKDATMPNGQKYEEWLKDKEGRGADGGERGPS